MAIPFETFLNYGSGLEGFSSCVVSTQILLGFSAFSFIKKDFFNFGFILFYSKALLCHSLAITFIANFLPKTLLPTLDQAKHPFQQVSTSFRFLFYLFLYQIFFCHFSGPLGFTKEVPNSFEL